MTEKDFDRIYSAYQAMIDQDQIDEDEGENPHIGDYAQYISLKRLKQRASLYLTP